MQVLIKMPTRRIHTTEEMKSAYQILQENVTTSSARRKCGHLALDVTAFSVLIILSKATIAIITM